MAQTLELNTNGTAARTPGPDPLIGKELLHYRVVEVIGQGGMSVVYRGHDAHLHRDVAIKVLHPFLAEKADCRARLAREARAVARLEHPHILKVFDFSGDPPTVDEKPDSSRVRGFAEGFIVAELVRGSTLKRFAEDHELWKVPEAGAMVVWQIAKALEHAHAHGVVHRDIKPENIMVRDDGWLKLMDFGIAHIADQKGLTVTGTLLGSPAHMAPECIDGHAADHRSDLFSLGTVLYWLATGYLPFEALTPHALLKQIVEGRSVPAQQRSPRVSDDLARVIAKSMATKPEERYPNAGAFVTALEELLDKAGLAAAPDKLRAMLGATDAKLAESAKSVRDAHLARAEKYIADKSPVRALSCLSRVLADDNQDADARALLERAQGDIETTDPASAQGAQGVGANDAPESLVSPLVSPLVSSRDVTAVTGGAPPRVVEPEPRSLQRTALQLGVVAAAAALIASAVVIATRLDDAKDERARNAVVDEDTTLGVPTNTGAPDQPEVELGAPSLPTDDKRDARRDDDKRGDDKRDDDKRDDDKRDREDKRDRDKQKDVAKIAGAGPAVVVAPPPNVAAAGKRVVNVMVQGRAWADVFLDGTLIASSKRGRFTVEVPLGEHALSFKNPKAKTHETKLSVTETGAIADVVVKLEPEPALLVVNCNVPDAKVTVGKQGARIASQTTANPYLVMMPDGAAELEVAVYKKGYKAFVQKHPFVSGERAQPLNVVLEPDANEGGGGP